MSSCRSAAIVLGITSVLLVGVEGAEAARPYGPPSKVMRGEKSFVTVVTAVQAVAPEKFLFEKREDLIGTAPERFEVRMVDGTAAEVKPGEVYVLGHSGFLGNYRFPGIKHDDPEGEKITTTPGVGPTLFPDAPVVRFLVTSSDPKKAPQDRMLLDAALYGLAQKETRVRRLATFELYFRPGLGALVSDRDVLAVRGALADPALEPLVRDHLLQIVGFWPERVRGSWYAEAAREVLKAQPGAQVEINSAVPSLLSTCLKILQSAGGPDDAGVASRFVASNNRYVAETALQVLEAQAPDKALPSAEAALAGEGVTGETRRFLEHYVEQEKKRQQSPEGASRHGSRASPDAAAVSSGSVTALPSSQHIPLQRPRM